MMERFLTNEKYPLLIAKTAIAIQLLFTISIVYALISLAGMKPTILLVNLLLFDILFICIHTSYRISYKGPRTALPRSQKRMLLGHILASLSALFLSLFLAFASVVYFSTAMVSIFFWAISFFLGIMFFFRKYRKIEESQ
jgi:hypothetical protein